MRVFLILIASLLTRLALWLWGRLSLWGLLAGALWYYYSRTWESYTLALTCLILLELARIRGRGIID